MITVYNVCLPFLSPIQTALIEIQKKQSIIIRISNNGLSGYGEIPILNIDGYCSESIDDVCKELKSWTDEFLVTTIDLFFNKLSQTLKASGRRKLSYLGLSMAYYDLKRREQGRSLRDMYGGTAQSILPIGVIGALPLDQSITEINKLKALGFKHFKIKAKDSLDLAKVSEIIKKLDLPGVISIDANGSLLASDISQLNALSISYVEQPFSREVLLSNKNILNELSVSVALDESVRSVEDLDSHQKVDFVSVKPSLIGVEESLKIIKKARERGIKPFIGGMFETGIGKSHLVAIRSVINNDLPAEIPPRGRYFKEQFNNFPDSCASLRSGIESLEVDEKLLEMASTSVFTSSL